MVADLQARHPVALGEVELLKYVAIDDCGVQINPLIVEGQILGGVAHGLSNALYEEAIYDERGQNLASTFLDYPLPTARERIAQSAARV